MNLNLENAQDNEFKFTVILWMRYYKRLNVFFVTNDLCDKKDKSENYREQSKIGFICFALMSEPNIAIYSVRNHIVILITKNTDWALFV